VIPIGLQIIFVVVNDLIVRTSLKLL